MTDKTLREAKAAALELVERLNYLRIVTDCDKREQLRAGQAASVMPLIGPLLDAWDGMANDEKGGLEEDSPSLCESLRKIGWAMENAPPLPQGERASDAQAEGAVPIPLADAEMLLSWMDETFGNDGGDWIDADAAAVGDALGKAIEAFKRMRALTAAPEKVADCGNTPYDEGPFTLAAPGQGHAFHAEGYPMQAITDEARNVLVASNATGGEGNCA